jgi:serine/threonine-protein kinase
MSRDDVPTDVVEVGKPTEPDVEAPERDDSLELPSGRYQTIRRLGKGGMGEVMAVRDLVIGREVALKRIRRNAPSDAVVRRFLREAAIQARLDHPAIVPVHDIGEDRSGAPYFTMKRLSGTTLASILDGDRAGYPPQRLLRAFAEVCLAIEFAHVRGIVHRDLKPENIVLGDYGEVYVLDWGVAKVTSGGDHDAELGDSGIVAPGGTQVGASIGTPGYMAPEQILGEADVDGRADVYALGCVLFEIVAGQMLHPTGEAGNRSVLAGGDARPSARAPWRDVPPELDRLCVEATAGDRSARLASARALGDGVHRFLDGDRDLARRRSSSDASTSSARARRSPRSRAATLLTMSLMTSAASRSARPRARSRSTRCSPALPSSSAG